MKCLIKDIECFDGAVLTSFVIHVHISIKLSVQFHLSTQQRLWHFDTRTHTAFGTGFVESMVVVLVLRNNIIVPREMGRMLKVNRNIFAWESSRRASWRALRVNGVGSVVSQ